jgi:hypothetical protein
VLGSGIEGRRAARILAARIVRGFERAAVALARRLDVYLLVTRVVGVARDE